MVGGRDSDCSAVLEQGKWVNNAIGGSLRLVESPARLLYVQCCLVNLPGGLLNHREFVLMLVGRRPS